MVLSRLWVNIKQGECNTIVFINRSCILPFAYTLKKEPFKLLDFFIYLKSRQNTPTSVVDEQVGDECSHISFHPCFLSVFHESFLKFFSRSWYNNVNKRRVSNMKSYRTYSSILSVNHPQNPRLFCSYASC